MKVKLNTTTSYEGKSLQSGDEVDISLNIAQRWINKGIAHIAKEEAKPITKSEVKEIKTDEPIIFTIQNGVIKDGFVTDEILPEITEENIGKLKTSKQKKKK